MTSEEKIHTARQVLEMLRKLPEANTPSVQKIIETMVDLEHRLEISVKRERVFEQRVNTILETLLRYTMMDFSKPADVGDDGDDLDAISLGLNTLAEELEDKIKAELAHIEKLKLQNDQLEKANLELASFAYVSSHDLQEPLRKINTYISRIHDEDLISLPEDIRLYLDRIRHSTTRMQILIRDILDYSRLTSHSEPAEVSDLEILAREVRNDFKEVLAEIGGTMEIGKLRSVAIVSFQLKRLLNNLVGNSIKFRDSDRPLKISITGEEVSGSEDQSQQAQRYFKIVYSDNGIGFEQQYSERIFEVFQRLHSQSEYEGTGVGLAICKKIVENQNGNIAAFGKLGEGARFEILLPL